MNQATASNRNDPRQDRLLVRRLGIVDYETVWRAMQAFTDRRTPETSDELWIVQHPPVFTLGQAGRREHVLAPGDIPVLQVDRGGQVTYHGPGQIVAYPLLDIRRLGITVKQLVEAIEEAVIRVVQDYGVTAGRVTGAPGVYVDGEKIAALGLRVRRGRSFHGLAFNIDMDLEPYRRINPCGFEGLRVTQLADLADVTLPEVEDRLVAAMAGLIGYPGRVRDADGELPDGLSAEA